ncbi:MAG: expansin EXLX1 family cellulose-binding protein [Umezawaea sp.]
MSGRWSVVAVVLLVAVAAVVGVVALRGGADVVGNPVAAAEPISPSTSEPVPTTSSTLPASSTPTTATTTAPVTTTPAPVAAPRAGKIQPGVPRDGVATFYDSDGGGACSYDPGPDPLTAAMNRSDYENSQACGAHLLVRTAGGATVTVRITNLCPECRAGQLDLSAEAFALLAAPNAGEIPVTWTLVSPPVSKDVSLRYKSGSSRYWCGIQVIDHRNPVVLLEVESGGRWVPLARTEYNYFLSEDGSGCGGAVAVTDIHGERLVVDPLPVQPDVVQATGLQFAVH